MNEVAKAYRLGYHKVFGSLELLRALSNESSISYMSKKMFSSMVASFPTSGGYLKAYTIRLSIVRGTNILRRSHINGNPKIEKIEVSSDLIHSTTLLSRVILLAENHKDTEFYKFLATEVARENKIGNIIIQFDPNGGGGRTTSDEYSHYQTTRERLCLCVMDSDVKYPGCGLGDSARAVASTDEDANPLTKFITTSSLEVENLLPTVALEAYLGEGNPLKIAINTYKRLERLGLTDSRRYIDIKKGMRIYDIISKSQDSPFYKYWRPITESLLELTLSSSACPFGIECDKKTCTCIVIPHLGQSILEQTLPHLKEYAGNQFSTWLDGHLTDEWQRMGRIVIDWCCGANLRAI